MSSFEYIPPRRFSRSVYGCQVPVENFRLKSLLLLIGLGEIRKFGPTFSSKTKLAVDFMILPYQKNNSNSIQHIINKFPNQNRKKLDHFFQSAALKNRGFHENIFNELTYAFGYKEENNHLGCFLHLYRIFEQIALCLPVISVIKNGSLNNTFLDFKGLFEGGAKSDLAVLKKYSRNHLDDSVASSVARFSFYRTSNPRQNVEVIKRFIKCSDIVSASPDHIEIKYSNIDTLVIGFRNQFFHYLFHEKNLSIKDIKHPAEFLEVCNPIFINYFCFLFRELIESEMLIWGS